MNGKRASKTNVVTEYMNETVNYGGRRMLRHRMLKLLTKAAKATGHENWRILVDRYLQGQELMQKRCQV